MAPKPSITVNAQTHIIGDSMTYTVKSNRSGFNVLQWFDNYDKALNFYKDECIAIGGPVMLCRWDHQGNLIEVLHATGE